MSTRSTIAVKLNTGKILASYVHYDGYLEGVGKTLLGFYNDANKSEALIRLGDLSSVGERLAPNDNESHSFDWPAQGVTVAYYRDRGEDGVDSIDFDSIGEWVTFFSEHADAEYFYIYINDDWHIVDSTGALSNLEAELDDQ